jgi:hypothetical protein
MDRYGVACNALFVASSPSKQPWQRMDTQSGRGLPQSTTLREIPRR